MSKKHQNVPKNTIALHLFELQALFSCAMHSHLPKSSRPLSTLSIYLITTPLEKQ